MDDTVTNQEIMSLLYPQRKDAVNPRKEPDYSYIHKELAKPGVNLSLLWTEYCSKCDSEGCTPYMYSQFCDKYRHWARLTKATMRIKHKPGEAMQVDWAGTTIQYQDPVTAETYDAYIFAAVLPCSCYAYVEACEDMKSTNWLLCHVHAYEYFGGVTRLLIPDNLKTGVVKNTRYDTVLNKSYHEMAEYYETAIVPARVLHPRDKSLAEGTVKFATTWIIAALRNRKFFSFEEVQCAVAEKLEELNQYPFKKREGCRYSAYSDEEQAFMKPLPLTPYEPAVWSTAKVPLDYLITDGKNKYSVPFDLIGEEVDIRLTKTMVEVFFHGSRVASHKRVLRSLRDPMCSQNICRSNTVNISPTTQMNLSAGHRMQGSIHWLLLKRSYPLAGNQNKDINPVQVSPALVDKYGLDRLEKACERVIAYSVQPSVRNISTILKNRQDKLASALSDVPKPPKSHGITRGAAYFQRGGTQR